MRVLQQFNNLCLNKVSKMKELDLKEVENYISSNYIVESVYFDKLIKIYPNNNFIYLMYQYILIKGSKYLEAVKLNQFISGSIDLSLKLMNDGLLDIYYYNNSNGLDLLVKSYELSKNNKWVRLELFYFLKEIENYKAFGYLEESIKIDINFFEAIHQRVLNYDIIYNCEEIISDISRFPETYLNEEILNILAFAYYNSYQIDDSAKTLLKSLKIKKTAKAFHLLGIISNDEYDYEKAQNFYNQSLEINPNQKDVIVSKAWMLYDESKFIEAELEFVSLLRFDKLQETYNQIIQFYFKILNLEKSNFYILKSREINGVNYMNEIYEIVHQGFIDNEEFNILFRKFKNKYDNYELDKFFEIYKEYGNLR